MFIGDVFFTKIFEGYSYKDAYNKSVHWYADNVVRRELNNVAMKIEKQSPKKNDDVRRVLLVLYVICDEGNEKERNCSICNEMSGHFYMQENKYKCHVCKIVPYRKRLYNRISELKKGVSKILEV